MDYELLRIAIAVLGCLALSYFDIFNKKNVPDRLLQAFLGISIILALISFQQDSLLISFGIPAIFGLGGYLAYKAGHIGGADVYAITSLALLLPSQPLLLQIRESSPLLGLPFIFPILYYSILLFCIYVMLWNAGKICGALREGSLKPEPQRLLQAFPLGAAYVAFVFISPGSISQYYLLSISIIFLSGIFFILFGSFLKHSAVSNVPAKKISEEDVLALEFMDSKLVAKYSLPKVVSQAELSRLKKLPIKKFAVYTGMPMFLPFLLLGLVIALYFGNLFLLPF